MKRKLASLTVAGLLLVGIVGWNLLADSMTQKQQKAEVNIGKGFTLAGVQLKPGNYLVVHKPDAMAAGTECTFLYRIPRISDKEEVVKLRCTASQGPVVKEFTLTSTRQPDGTYAINTIQFAGSTEIHSYEAAR